MVKMFQVGTEAAVWRHHRYYISKIYVMVQMFHVGTEAAVWWYLDFTWYINVKAQPFFIKIVDSACWVGLFVV